MVKFSNRKFKFNFSPLTERGLKLGRLTESIGIYFNFNTDLRIAEVSRHLHLLTNYYLTRHVGFLLSAFAACRVKKVLGL